MADNDDIPQELRDRVGRQRVMVGFVGGVVSLRKSTSLLDEVMPVPTNRPPNAT